MVALGYYFDKNNLHTLGISFLLFFAGVISNELG